MNGHKAIIKTFLCVAADGHFTYPGIWTAFLHIAESIRD